MTDHMDTEALQALVGDLRQYHFDKEADVMEALAAEVLELRAKLDAEKALADRLAAQLKIAEAALSDIGDAEREDGDDLAWCEARAAKAIPETRAEIAAYRKARGL